MPQGRELTAKERSVVSKMIKAGIPYREIQERTGYSINTICKVNKRIKTIRNVKLAALGVARAARAAKRNALAVDLV